MAELKDGKIKWFNDEKGYGFIEQDDGGKDVFVHFRQVNNNTGGRVSLADGQKVTFWSSAKDTRPPPLLLT